MTDPEIEAFHAKARRRRGVITALALIVMLVVGVVVVWLSAITEKSTTFTRGVDLDRGTRTVVVAAFVVLVIFAFVYRMRKDRR